MSLTPMSAEQVAAASKPPAGTSTPAPAPVETTTTEVAAEPKTLEALKAARRASATEPPAGGETAKTDPPKPGKTIKTVDVKVPDEKLETFKKLNSELTEARAKLSALEGKAPNAEKVEKATKLIEQGKAFDAIIDLVGIKAFNAAVAEVTGANPKAVPLTEAEQARADELEALKKDNASTKEALAAAAAQQREFGVSKIIDEVKSLPEKFVYLSRSPEWVRKTLDRVDKSTEPGKPSAYEQAEALSMTKNGRGMNADEKNALIRAALEVAEEEHAATAKLYGATEPPKPAAPKPAPRTIDRTMRGNVTKILPRATSATLEQLKAERRGRA